MSSISARVLLAFALILFFSSVYAQEINVTLDVIGTIDACGYVITVPGRYIVISDLNLTDTYPYCIDVFVSDVEIDCQWHRIQDYSGAYLSDGINVRSSVSNVTIKNCDIRGFTGESGIFLRGDNSNIVVSNVYIQDSKIGIIAGRTARDVKMENVSIYNINNPIWFDYVEGLFIRGLTVSNSGDFLVNGTAVDFGYSSFEYYNRGVLSRMSLRNSSFHNNVIVAVNDNYTSMIVMFWILDSENVEIYNNEMYANSTPAPSRYAWIALVLRGNVYNISIHDNYGYGGYPDGVTVGVSAAAYNAKDVYVYNNFFESTAYSCLSLTRGSRQYFYNNTILDGCIWVLGPVSDIYIYDNKFSSFIIYGYRGRIDNMFAYNNTIFGDKFEGVLIYYLGKLYGSNIYHPLATTLEPYVSVLFSAYDVYLGSVFPSQYAEGILGMSVETNRIDYGVRIDATDLTSDGGVIPYTNYEFEIRKNDSLILKTYPGSVFTIFKQLLEAAYDYLIRLYVPLVPSGRYTGTITITVSVGEVPDIQALNPSNVGVDLEMV